MAKHDNKGGAPAQRYRQVEVANLNRGRHGKHYDLVEGILKELETAAIGSALQIPLSDVGGIGLPNLRSAVHRGSASKGVEVETLADEKNFYVWRTARAKAE